MGGPGRAARHTDGAGARGRPRQLRRHDDAWRSVPQCAVWPHRPLPWRRIILNMPVIRRGEPGDLARIAAIQAASPEAPSWPVGDYLKYDLLVAVSETRVAAFLAYRTLAEGEREILNLAVAPEFRRKGIARRLWNVFLEHFRGSVFLEVRESNLAALNLYVSLGFQGLGRRPGYYENPPEAAVVMKFHSC